VQLSLVICGTRWGGLGGLEYSVELLDERWVAVSSVCVIVWAHDLVVAGLAPGCHMVRILLLFIWVLCPTARMVEAV